MHTTVLGAGGFIGSRLTAALLRDGASVTAPARDDPAIFTRDLGRVFYCIGQTADYAANPAATVEAHAGLLARLLSQARFEHIIYLSSTRLYDDAISEAGAADSVLQLDPRKPRHLYDLSKALGENLCLTAANGRGSVARLSGVFDTAPGSPGFLSHWLQRARRERAFTLPSAGETLRDYIHVDDVVAALRKMAGLAPRAIWNIASGEALSNADIAALFNARGWRMDFTKDAAPQHLPRCDISPMIAHGVTPRSPRALIANWLDGINPP